MNILDVIPMSPDEYAVLVGTALAYIIYYGIIYCLLLMLIFIFNRSMKCLRK